MAKIYHADLYGLREDKYKTLSENTINSTEFKQVNPQSEFYLFIPQNTDLFGEYEQYLKITDIMPINSVGIVTARDKLTIQDTAKNVRQIVNDFVSLDVKKAREKYNLGKDSRDWKVSFAQKDIKDSNINSDLIKPILYRPFDTRYTYYTGKNRGFICMPRPEVMKNMLLGDNLGLVTNRQVKIHYNHIFISNHFIDFHLLETANANASLFTLYIYPDTERPQ